MAGSNLRKFKNPEVLRKFSFQRLLEMVGRYKGYFDRMQFQIDGATEEKITARLAEEAATPRPRSRRRRPRREIGEAAVTVEQGENE